MIRALSLLAALCVVCHANDAFLSSSEKRRLQGHETEIMIDGILGIIRDIIDPDKVHDDVTDTVDKVYDYLDDIIDLDKNTTDVDVLDSIYDDVKDVVDGVDDIATDVGDKVVDGVAGIVDDGLDKIYDIEIIDKIEDIYEDLKVLAETTSPDLDGVYDLVKDLIDLDVKNYTDIDIIGKIYDYLNIDKDLIDGDLAEKLYDYLDIAKNIPGDIPDKPDDYLDIAKNIPGNITDKVYDLVKDLIDLDVKDYTDIDIIGKIYDLVKDLIDLDVKDHTDIDIDIIGKIYDLVKGSIDLDVKNYTDIDIIGKIYDLVKDLIDLDVKNQTDIDIIGKIYDYLNIDKDLIDGDLAEKLYDYLDIAKNIPGDITDKVYDLVKDLIDLDVKNYTDIDIVGKIYDYLNIDKDLIDGDLAEKLYDYLDIAKNITGNIPDKVYDLVKDLIDLDVKDYTDIDIIGKIYDLVKGSIDLDVKDYTDIDIIGKIYDLVKDLIDLDVKNQTDIDIIGKIYDYLNIDKDLIDGVLTERPALVPFMAFDGAKRLYYLEKPFVPTSLTHTKPGLFKMLDAFDTSRSGVIFDGNRTQVLSLLVPVKASAPASARATIAVREGLDAHQIVEASIVVMPGAVYVAEAGSSLARSDSLREACQRYVFSFLLPGRGDSRSHALLPAFITCIMYGGIPLVDGNHDFLSLKQISFFLPFAVMPIENFRPDRAIVYLGSQLSPHHVWARRNAAHMVSLLMRYRYRLSHHERLMRHATALCEERAMGADRHLAIFAVKSAVGHRGRRDAIRMSWGRLFRGIVGKASLKNSRLIFFVGLTNDTSSANATTDEASMLLEEQRQHRDIVMVWANDGYEWHVTRKTIEILRYVHMGSADYVKSISEAESPHNGQMVVFREVNRGTRGKVGSGHWSYLTIVDDDVYLRPLYLLERLQHSPRAEYLWGFIEYGSHVVRKPSSENNITLDAFPEPRDVYPPFALGPCFALSRDIVGLLVEAGSSDSSYPLLQYDDITIGLWLWTLVFKHNKTGLQLDDRDRTRMAFEPKCGSPWAPIQNNTWMVHHVTAAHVQCMWRTDVRNGLYRPPVRMATARRGIGVRRRRGFPRRRARRRGRQWRVRQVGWRTLHEQILPSLCHCVA
ncbi:unnamed protein product [Vitrella brassicaformis CCMP3155]|uniref:Hexosyltransferase n=2 Tax=Vitrella brassicaformis TaxID=1169539 RepID=A0A0G4EYE8_VITBC|nr:unnamed protein product [Vitrella brassicaformis CCMP3155]|eukprot:CEM04165.1 unnamed protein product [Vitrella brassicaformis CCMP3155]